MEHKKLYLLKNYDIYEKIKDGEEIIFYSKKDNDEFEPVMRYAFRSNQKSMFNEKEIDDSNVFRFHKIDNYFFTASVEDYAKYINQGFMTATFCYLILQLLHDKRLARIDFEINLVNRASVIKNEIQEFKPDIYDKLLGRNYGGAIEDKFKVFFTTNREEDIEYYQELFDSKNVEILKPIKNRKFLNVFKKIYSVIVYSLKSRK